MIIILGNKTYKTSGCGINESLQGSPQLINVLEVGQSRLTFQVAEYPPFADARPTVVICINQNGNVLFRGYLADYKLSYTEFGVMTTITCIDYSRHLRYRPIQGKFKDSLENLVITFLDLAGANVFSPVIYNIDNTIDPLTLQTISIKEVEIEIFLDYEYLQEALNKITSIVNCKWYISASDGTLHIYQNNLLQDNHQILDITSLLGNCGVDTKPESISYSNQFSMVNKILVYGRNGENLLGQETFLSIQDQQSADIPQGGLQTDYSIIPDLATYVTMAKIIAYDPDMPHVPCNFIAIASNYTGDVFSNEGGFAFIQANSGSGESSGSVTANFTGVTVDEPYNLVIILNGFSAGSGVEAIASITLLGNIWTGTVFGGTIAPTIIIPGVTLTQAQAGILISITCEVIGGTGTANLDIGNSGVVLNCEPIYTNVLSVSNAQPDTTVDETSLVQTAALVVSGPDTSTGSIDLTYTGAETLPDVVISVYIPAFLSVVPDTSGPTDGSCTVLGSFFASLTGITTPSEQQFLFTLQTTKAAIEAGVTIYFSVTVDGDTNDSANVEINRIGFRPYISYEQL